MNTTGRLTEETKSSIQRGKWNHFMRFTLCCWLKNQKIYLQHLGYSRADVPQQLDASARSILLIVWKKNRVLDYWMTPRTFFSKLVKVGHQFADFDPNPVVDHLWVRASNMKALSLWNVQLPSVFFSMKMRWLAKLLWNRPPNATWKENWHTKQKCV